MLENYFVDTCYIVELTRNRFSDRVYKTIAVESCRFREGDTINRAGHQENSDTDAMLWLKPDTVAKKDSIILVGDTYYQVNKFLGAKRLGETEIQFYKCDLKITDIAIS